MADLIAVVPSRGRPQAAYELAEVFQATATANTTLLFAVDEDDPSFSAYEEASTTASVPIEKANSSGAPSSMVKALNLAAMHYANLDDPPFAIGFMGDDHRPRGVGWDKTYLDALRELGTGIVYGDDLLQRQNLPTQCAMTTDIVRALGYMAPPMLKHLYVDNFWRDLGNAAGCLRYLPEVVIEHRHPIARKAAWDEGYERVNAPAMYEHDRAAYESYWRGQFGADVAKVKALRHG